MKHDINGWGFLKERLSNFPETQNVFDAVFGRGMDLSLIEKGIHLLSIRQIRQLVLGLHLNKKHSSEFYNQLIIARCAAGCGHQLEELKQMLE